MIILVIAVAIEITVMAGMLNSVVSYVCIYMKENLIVRTVTLMIYRREKYNAQ